MRNFKISSPQFEHKGSIPIKYTCDGEDVNPPLIIDGIPEKAKSLVLIMDDPDAPMGTWVHWVVWNVPLINTIEENSVPGVEGINDFNRHGYGGPCPPSGSHRYFFKVYALTTELDLNTSSTKKDVERAMEDSIITKAELVGLYSRN